MRLQAKRMSAEDFTRAARWPRGVLSAFMYGDKIPSLAKANDLRRILGIEPASFVRRPTRAFVPPGAHRAQPDARSAVSQRLHR